MGRIGHGDASKGILQIGKMIAGHIESVYCKLPSTRKRFQKGLSGVYCVQVIEDRVAYPFPNPLAGGAIQQ